LRHLLFCATGDLGDPYFLPTPLLSHNFDVLFCAIPEFAPLSACVTFDSPSGMRSLYLFAPRTEFAPFQIWITTDLGPDHVSARAPPSVASTVSTRLDIPGQSTDWVRSFSLVGQIPPRELQLRINLSRRVE
jgi:hypothetical protein